jgi:hypothetical protein
MSPRSQEFMDEARDRLAAARQIAKSGHPGSVVNAAYYAMLNAARAALSERGEHSKSHSGTWTLFSATFVATGEFDRDPANEPGSPHRPRREPRGSSASPRIAASTRCCAGRWRWLQSGVTRSNSFSFAVMTANGSQGQAQAGETADCPWSRKTVAP